MKWTVLLFLPLHIIYAAPAGSLDISTGGIEAICLDSDPKPFYCETYGQPTDNITFTFTKQSGGTFEEIAKPYEEFHYRKIITNANQKVRASLKIEQVTRADEGYYQCKVENGNRQSMGHIQLRVIDCPEEVLIMITGLDPKAFVRYRLMDLPIWHTFIFSRNQKEINGRRGNITCSIMTPGQDKELLQTSVDVVFSNRTPSKPYTCKLPYKGRDFELSVDYDFY